jgi:hypothetical protein
MKKNLILLSTLLLSTLIFTACGGGNSSNESTTSTATTSGTNTTTTNSSNDETTTIDDSTSYSEDSSESSSETVINKTITVTEEYQVESLGKANTINATVSLGSTAKDLYIVLSNYAHTSSSSTITHNARMVGSIQSKSVSSLHFIQRSSMLHAPKYVQDFSSKLSTLLSRSIGTEPQAKTIAVSERKEDIVSESKTFYLDADGIQTTMATARKVVSDVATAFGSKTLNIWVSDDSFDSGSGCSKSNCVTQTMVDQLADTFLTDGSDNDIYDWVTNIYEEEWGSDAQAKYSQLIPEDDEITILLTDIDGDNRTNGGVIGFFWSKDNIDKATVSGSNERIMFYADAVMFANGEGSWDINDFWPKEMVSTLAHEFQHMIHFYQKTILLLDDANGDTDTWINEMLAETTEDLVATKIRHSGPRGVEYTDGSSGTVGNTDGRYPLFNENNTLSLTAWNNRLEDYSKVNAFGTYLIRNYDGAKLLHDIMHNTYTDEQAIVDAVNKSAAGAEKTFNNLLSEWGVAVLLSNIESPENLPTYNTGDFMDSTYGNTTYEMGSINFFNYDPSPTLYTTTGTVKAQGNYYYKIGNHLTGDINIHLELNGETEATLIAK